MKDRDAIEEIKNKYVNNNTYIEVEKVTKATLENLLLTCDNTKHMEERIEWYDDETNPDRNNWVDIEGEGYGWIWSNHPENKWHEALKQSLLSYIKQKESAINKQDEYVLVIKEENKVVYHFVERESSLCDTIYTFSKNKLSY